MTGSVKNIEYRLLEIICILIFLAFGFFVVEDISMGSRPLTLTLDAFLLLVGISVFIYLKVKGNHRRLVIPFVVLLNLLTMVYWFWLNGVHGPTSIGVIATITISLILVPAAYTRVFIGWSMVMLIILVSGQYLGWVQHGMVNANLMPINYLIISLCVVMLIGSLKMEISSEREGIKDKNRKLFKLNTQLKKIIDDQKHTLDRLQKTQNQLIETEKMATVGKITAELAHELNNPINYIGGSLLPIEATISDLRNHLPAGKDDDRFQDLQELLDTAKEGTAKTTAIIQNLMALSPKAGTSCQNVSLSEVIETNLSIFNRLFPGIRFQLDLDVGIHLGFTATDQHQILRNSIQRIILASEEDTTDVWIKTRVDDQYHVMISNQSPPGLNGTLSMEKSDMNLDLFIIDSLVRKHCGTMMISGRRNISALKLSFPKS